MIDREWMATAMQDRYAEATEDERSTEQCVCGHSPALHHWVRQQYRRPDSCPCSECPRCMDYEEAGE